MLGMGLAAGSVVLRPRAVYGPGDPHLMPRLRRIVRGGRAWLPGPDVPLSLTAVENLASACLAAKSLPTDKPVRPSSVWSVERLSACFSMTERSDLAVTSATWVTTP